MYGMKKAENRMITQHILFTEKLWSFQMPDHEHWKTQISNIMLVEKNKDKHKYSTQPLEECNVKAPRTSWDSHAQYPAVNHISNIIMKTFLPEIWKTEKFKVPGVCIESSWINFYTKNHYAVAHHHRPSIYSIVYFVKVPKNSCKFLVYNEKRILESELDENKYELTVDAVEGTVIVFHGNVVHSVTPNQSDETRITLAANYHVHYPKERETDDKK